MKDHGTHGAPSDVIALLDAAKRERDEARAELSRRQRAGQTVFNALCKIDPCFAEAIRGGDVDPFYDDARIAPMLAAWHREILARGGAA